MDTTYDTIIVGTGAAGLFTALSLPKTKKILMITKDTLEHSDSYLAQGGISTQLNEEDYSLYFEDTMRAGRYENRKDSVRIMIEDSRQIIDDLIHYGVEFDRNKTGDLDYTREGAHSTYRILHHKDITGKEIVTKLLSLIKKRDNITLLEHTTMLDIITNDNCCNGIVVLTLETNITPIFSPNVILATGGIGGLFQNSTNYPHITGDSFSIALKKGILLENINYIQIHPTALYSKKKGRKFLISESVRGEGAILLNAKNERFIDELLPRDIVTNAIQQEMKKHKSNYVFLSFTCMSKASIQKRFPNIYEHCKNEGYQLGKEAIPVAPAQHYLMGGIKTDVNGVTSIAHLYAVGETACNGVHGANRLASNSLLESLVFAKRAAKHLLHSNPTVIATQTFDLTPYENYNEYIEHNQQLLKNELKRKDRKFYEQWF